MNFAAGVRSFFLGTGQSVLRPVVLGAVAVVLGGGVLYGAYRAISWVVSAISKKLHERAEAKKLADLNKPEPDPEVNSQSKVLTALKSLWKKMCTEVSNFRTSIADLLAGKDRELPVKETTIPEITPEIPEKIIAIEATKNLESNIEEKVAEVQAEVQAEAKAEVQVKVQTKVQTVSQSEPPAVMDSTKTKTTILRGTFQRVSSVKHSAAIALGLGNGIFNSFRKQQVTDVKSTIGKNNRKINSPKAKATATHTL